jgi:hypothetical protein
MTRQSRHGVGTNQYATKPKSWAGEHVAADGLADTIGEDSGMDDSPAPQAPPTWPLGSDVIADADAFNETYPPGTYLAIKSDPGARERVIKVTGPAQETGGHNIGSEYHLGGIRYQARSLEFPSAIDGVDTSQSLLLEPVGEGYDRHYPNWQIRAVSEQDAAAAQQARAARRQEIARQEQVRATALAEADSQVSSIISQAVAASEGQLTERDVFMALARKHGVKLASW